MPFLPRRIFETFFAEFLISAMLALIFQAEFLPQIKIVVVLTMLLATALNIALTVFFGRAYILSVDELKAYYLVNLTAIALLTAVSALTAYFDIEPVYTWLFFPFKLFYFWHDWPKALSALAVGGILLATAAIVPVFVKIIPDKLNDK